MEYCYGDLANPVVATEALIDIDVVIHAISTTVPATANLDPVADTQGNLVGTVRLLQKMHEIGVPKMVYISSGGTVYGNVDPIPISENHARNPISSYGNSQGRH